MTANVSQNISCQITMLRFYGFMLLPTAMEQRVTVLRLPINHNFLSDYFSRIRIYRNVSARNEHYSSCYYTTKSLFALSKNTIEGCIYLALSPMIPSTLSHLLSLDQECTFRNLKHQCLLVSYLI